jgi:hypothetical protein
LHIGLGPLDVVVRDDQVAAKPLVMAFAVIVAYER